jgi:hypothetical protein
MKIAIKKMMIKFEKKKKQIRGLIILDWGVKLKRKIKLME